MAPSLRNRSSAVIGLSTIGNLTNKVASVATNSEKTTAEVHLTVFRMAQLPSGCVCLCTDDFVECPCYNYTNCPKCKENGPPPKKKCFSLKISKGKQRSTDSKPYEDKPLWKC